MIGFGAAGDQDILSRRLPGTPREASATTVASQAVLSSEPARLNRARVFCAMNLTRKQSDEVTIEMVQLPQGVDVLVFDRFVRRHFFLAGVMVAEVPIAKVAEIHRRKSCEISRRN